MPNTDLTVVLDRSGSMMDIVMPMERGFNDFMKEQREVLSSLLTVSLVQFDDEEEVVYTALPSHQVPPLRISPRGSTALYDALGNTIMRTGKRLRDMPTAGRPEKVIFMIITDGQENASVKYGQAQIRKMIAEQKDKYSWEFVFLGANFDAFGAGNRLGATAMGQYHCNAKSVGAMYNALSENIADVRCGIKADMTFTAAQQQKMDPGGKTSTP